MKRVLMFASVLCGLFGCPSGITVDPPPPKEISLNDCQDEVDNDDNGWIDCWDAGCCDWGVCYNQPLCVFLRTQGDSSEQGFFADTTIQFDTLSQIDTSVAIKDAAEDVASSNDAVLDALPDSSDTETTTIAALVDSYDTEVAEVKPTIVPPDIFEVETHDVDATSFWLPDIIINPPPDVLEEETVFPILADAGGSDVHNIDVPLASLPDVSAVVDDSEVAKVDAKAEIAVADVGVDAEVEVAVETLAPPLPTDISVGAIDLAYDDSSSDSSSVIETQSQETASSVDTQIDTLLPPVEKSEEFPGPICEMNPEGDKDGDGLLNIEECNIGSNLQNPDTDNDGLSDYLDLSPTGDEGGGSCILYTDSPTINIKPGQGFLISPLKVLAILANGWYYSSTDKICPLTNAPFQQHLGYDYFVGKGIAVVASCDGYAVADQQPWNNGNPEEKEGSALGPNSPNYGFGILVIVKCDKPIYDTDGNAHTLYVMTSHLFSSVLTLENGIRQTFHKKTNYGTKVIAGQVLGQSGRSGAQSWWHLDYRVYLDDYSNYGWKKNALDPYDIRAQTAKTGCSSARWYPKNALGCDFTECGPNHLWKECPPVAACDDTGCANQSPYTATIPGAYIPYDETKNNCKNNSLIKDSCFDQCPSGYTSCSFLTEKCGNGLDDDEDNKSDCLDSDCWSGAECAPMIETVVCGSCEQGETNVTCTIQGTNFLKTDSEFNVWIEDFDMNNASKKLINSNKIEVISSWLCDKPVGFKKAAYRHPGAPAAPAGCVNTNYSSCQEKAVDVWSGCDGAECGTDLCGENCGNCNNGAWCDYFSGVDYGLCYGGICEGGGNDSSNCCAPNCSNKQCGDDGCGVDCGNCNLTHASAKCVNYKCDIDSCQLGYNNCNANTQDGCETTGPCGGCPECTTLSGTSCMPLSDGIVCVSDNNTCTTDTCQSGQCKHNAMTCNIPPANECVDNSLRVYVSMGACSGGNCSYSYTDTNCPFGCTGKQCNGDPCIGISCVNPPAPTCGQDKKVIYNTPGVCSWGICSYPSLTEISCADSDACTIDTCENGNCVNTPKSCSLAHASAKCANGGCMIASCESGYNDCNNSPSDGCETTGPCGGCPECTMLSGTSCVQVQNLTTCSSDGDSCTKDFCNEGNCQHVPINCYSQKPSECLDSNNLKVYNPQGKCVDGVCAFNDYTTQSCQYGCSDGQCLNDPCAGVVCNNPPTPTCNSNGTSKIVYNTPGVCSWGICNYSSYVEISCADGSSCTDDYCVGGDCINPQKANTCNPGQCGWSADGCFYCGACECSPGDTDEQLCDPTPGQMDYCIFVQTRTCTAAGKWGAWGACVGDPYGSPYEYSFDTACGNTICITVDYIYDDGTVDGYISRKDGNKWGNYYIEWIVKDSNGATLDEPFPGDHCQPLYENAYEISFDFKAQKLSLSIAGFAKIQATVWKGGTGNIDCSTYTMKSGETTIQRCY